MNQSNTTSPDDFFWDFIKNYGQAWDDNDLRKILDAYYTPCFIFKASRVHANLSEEAKHQYFQNLLDDYHQQLVVKAEIPHFEVKHFGEDSALITVEWVCKRADNFIAFDYWDSYFLIHTDNKWKILGDTVYE